MPETETAPALTYPADAWHVFYGRQVWSLGDGGEDGVLIENHDRRAYAALSRYLREEQYDHDVDPQERTVRAFVHDCGCTEAEHAKHRDGDVDCCDHCDDYGLPPCEPEMYSWSLDWAKDGQPGLPVLQVTW